MKRVAGLGLLLVVLVAGCRQKLDVDSAELIRTPEAARTAMKEVLDVAGPLIQKSLDGEELTGEDRARLASRLPTLNGLVQYDPKAFGPLAVRGKILILLNQPDRALESCAVAVGLLPAEPTREESIAAAECRFDISTVYFTRRDFDKAEIELREALRIVPDDLRYRLSLVQLLMEARRTDAAREELDKAAARRPDHPGVKRLRELLSEAASPSSDPKAEGTAPASP